MLSAIETTNKKNGMAANSLEGKTLGKYQILEPLGRGGMAQVYRAYHPQLDRYVAVKVLRPDLVEDREFLARFSREARSVAALRHPNIVQMYDFDSQDGTYYMVMELLEGDTLKATLNVYRTAGKRMPMGDGLRILTDVLAGLEYAHQEGIIHRDLKPANILLDRRGQAVLTDFGIAQIVGVTQYTVSGALMGTLSYMAPEQGLSGQCDARSDLYSLGIIYYELLTGRVPFDADTPLAILMKHVNDPLPLPRTIDPTIPEPFEAAALKALAKQPSERYQSAAEMAEALRGAASQAGVEIPLHLTLLPATAPLTAPVGRVGVFSGAAREQIADRGFASGDTDRDLKEKLAGRLRHPSDEAFWPDRWIANALRPLFQPPLGANLEDIHPLHVGRAAVYGSLAIVLGNICLLWAGGVTGWKIYTHAWSLELLLAGLLLSALMAALASPWFLIPSGIVLGNGIIFSYFTLTGRWPQWIFLWPLEPLLLAGSILGAIWLAGQRLGGRWASRRLGLIFLALAAVLGVALLIASSVLTVLGR
jgi:serine/threonine protein kinase